MGHSLDFFDGQKSVAAPKSITEVRPEDAGQARAPAAGGGGGPYALLPCQGAAVGRGEPARAGAARHLPEVPGAHTGEHRQA
eukprot:scaffold44322_cov42-Phaeocystis_antarctica.AAC.4